MYVIILEINENSQTVVSDVLQVNGREGSCQPFIYVTIRYEVVVSSRYMY